MYIVDILMFIVSLKQVYGNCSNYLLLGGNIIQDPDEGVSYDADPKGIYAVQIGTTLSNLEEMFMSKVASYRESVRLTFKCRYPYR